MAFIAMPQVKIFFFLSIHLLMHRIVYNFWLLQIQLI